MSPRAASPSTSSAAGSGASSTPTASRGSTTTSATGAPPSSSRCCSGLWNEETFSYRGDFYRLHEAWLAPRPAVTPEIFQGGNSSAARAMAARHSDWYFMNGGDLETVREQVAEVRALAAEQGRTPPFALNAFPVVRDTEEEALAALDRIVRHANADAVATCRPRPGRGRIDADRIGMWASSDVPRWCSRTTGSGRA